MRRAKQLVAYYEFKTMSGEVVKGRSQISRRAKLEPGAPVCVLYLPDNPRRSGLYPLELVKLDR